MEGPVDDGMRAGTSCFEENKEISKRQIDGREEEFKGVRGPKLVTYRHVQLGKP